MFREIANTRTPELPKLSELPDNYYDILLKLQSLYLTEEHIASVVNDLWLEDGQPDLSAKSKLSNIMTRADHYQLIAKMRMEILADTDARTILDYKIIGMT